MFTKLRIRYHRLSVFTWKDNGVQYFFLNLKWSNFIMIVCKTVAQRLSDKIFLLQRALGHTWHQVSPIGEKKKSYVGAKTSSDTISAETSPLPPSRTTSCCQTEWAHQIRSEEIPSAKERPETRLYIHDDRTSLMNSQRQAGKHKSVSNHVKDTDVWVEWKHYDWIASSFTCHCE